MSLWAEVSTRAEGNGSPRGLLGYAREVKWQLPTIL